MREFGIAHSNTHHPARVDYELTKLGESLIEPLGVLSASALKKRPPVERARQKFDER